MSLIDYIDGSAKFSDVLLYNRKLIFLTTSDIKFDFPIYKFPTKYQLDVVVKKFNNEEDINIYKHNLNIKKHINIMLYGDNPWYGNIGHALFDGLYPIYLSMIKFGYENEDFIYAAHSWNNYSTKSTESIKIFSGNQILNTDDYTDQYLYINTLFTGCGVNDSLCGNLVINKKYTLYGQSEFNGLTRFKHRMLNRLKLPIDNPINYQNPKIIIIQNKRFSQKEREVLTALTGIDKYQIKYIDWYHDYSSFSEQLCELNDVDVQITGPGTGMLYCPFLKHGAVNINLGYIDCTQSNTSRPNIFIKNATKDYCFPGWMEQSTCAACDYIHTLYYNRYIHNELELKSLCDIVDNAINTLNLNPKDNIRLNTDAIIFKEYCQKSKHANDICDHLTSMAFF